jgi:DNA-binding transcriptional LysR family regulator
LIARKIGEMRRVIVASPAYIAEKGKPKTPDDLLNHDCLLWDEEHDYLNRWPFEVNGVMRRIKVRSHLVSNNAQALYQLAIMGAGIFRMVEYRARPFIRRGELVPLLERSHHDEAISVHALYVRTNIAKPRVRAFVDFLIEKCAADPYSGMKPEASSDRTCAKRAAVVV